MTNNSERVDTIVEGGVTTRHQATTINLDTACFPENPWGDQIWNGLFLNRRIRLYLAVSNDQFIGFAAVAVQPPEADLLRIGIRETFRRQSRATDLMKTMIRDLGERGVDTIFLEVRKDNWPACELYRFNGFEQVGERKNYYQSPTGDALIFKQEIQQ